MPRESEALFEISVSRRLPLLSLFELGQSRKQLHSSCRPTQPHASGPTARKFARVVLHPAKVVDRGNIRVYDLEAMAFDIIAGSISNKRLHHTWLLLHRNVP